LILPGILYFLIFNYLPMYGLIIAFKDIKTVMTLQNIISAPFVGLKQFQRFTSSYFFWNIMNNTLAISLMKIVIGFPLPILFSLLLNEVRKAAFKRTVQTISYMPHFISMVVLCALVQIVLSPSGGVVNRISGLFGNEPVYYLGDPKYFRMIIVLSSVWKELGWSSIIYLAAIAGINPELSEAAAIDGAGRIRQVWHVILPGIKPTIVILFILRIGGIMNAGFEEILLLYSPPVYSVGDILDTYVYRVGIEQMNYSLSAAVGFFKSIISFVMVLGTNWFANRLGEEGLW